MNFNLNKLLIIFFLVYLSINLNDCHINKCKFENSLNDVNVAIGFYSRNKGIRANSIGTLNIAILFTDFTYTQSLKIYILEIRMVN